MPAAFGPNPANGGTPSMFTPVKQAAQSFFLSGARQIKYTGNGYMLVVLQPSGLKPGALSRA
jgi:hypothetical protein